MIFLARGHKVMLSGDLARLYGVEPRTLIQAVKRNIERFPEDFMFALTIEEAKSLRSQFVILKTVYFPGSSSSGVIYSRRRRGSSFGKRR